MEKDAGFRSSLPDSCENFFCDIEWNQVEQPEFGPVLSDEIIGGVAPLAGRYDFNALFFQLLGVFGVVVHIGRHEGNIVTQCLHIHKNTPSGSLTRRNIVFGNTVVNNEHFGGVASGTRYDVLRRGGVSQEMSANT